MDIMVVKSNIAPKCELSVDGTAQERHLTHWGLVTPHDIIDPGRHGFVLIIQAPGH